MGTYGFPDISGFYAMLYGTAGVDFGGLTLMYFGGASGMVFSGNPPFTVTDFFNFYSKFAGPPTKITGTLAQGSAVVNGVSGSDIAGLSPGQLLVNSNFPKDTLVLDIGTTSFTCSQPSSATTSAVSLTVYETPFIPIIVVLTFVNLALASVMSARYKAAWFMMMNLFVAHYSTMFMRTESGTPNQTAMQVAASGLTKGIIVGRSAGDVSAQSKIVEGQDAWGAWTETEYGVQFITIARATCAGPIFVP
ncbi:MAG TPA: DUF4054 domain-containing protein [Candidatus Saccharimonadales bacterium]|jgi:hypothetical protein